MTLARREEFIKFMLGSSLASFFERKETLVPLILGCFNV